MEDEAEGLGPELARGVVAGPVVERPEGVREVRPQLRGERVELPVGLGDPGPVAADGVDARPVRHELGE